MSLFSSWKDLFPYDPRTSQAEMMSFVRDGLINGKHLATEAQNGRSEEAHV